MFVTWHVIGAHFFPIEGAGTSPIEITIEGTVGNGTVALAPGSTGVTNGMTPMRLSCISSCQIAPSRFSASQLKMSRERGIPFSIRTRRASATCKRAAWSKTPLDTGFSARWQALSDYVQQQEAHGIRVSMALRAPDGERFCYRENEHFLAASTIKVPVVITLLRRVDRGELSLKKKHQVVWRDVYLGDGQGTKLEFSKGVDLSLLDLMYFAICMSDNNATNTLIELAGIDAVNDTMVELGMGHSQLGRQLRGYPAQPEEGMPNNWVTAHDLRALFESILAGTAAARASTEKLIDMLTWQENVHRIGFHYMDPAFTWGSKTGTVHADSHDVAFVQGPGGEMVLAVCTTGYPTWQEAEPPIAEMGRLAGVACGLLTEN